MSDFETLSAPGVVVSKEKSLDFFTDPRSYTGFDLTRDKKIMIGCIEPRLLGLVDCSQPARVDDLKTRLQTGGGAAGTGHDEALALTVEQGELVPIEYGIAKSADRRETAVLDGHYDCRFVNDMSAVLSEEANPNDFTLETLERWDRFYQTGLVKSSVLHKLMDAAAKEQEYVAEKTEMVSLIRFTDTLYPDHPNVRYVVGQNQARVHVTNHHPYVGLNRRRQVKHYGGQAQGYHDNLGAMRAELARIPDLGRKQRGLRLGSLMLRTAATRTVLGSLHEDTSYLEVFPSTDRSGIRVEARI
jgi:hypothetical protein